jgi:hypothetical protein
MKHHRKTSPCRCKEYSQSKRDHQGSHQIAQKGMGSHTLMMLHQKKSHRNMSLVVQLE